MDHEKCIDTTACPFCERELEKKKKTALIEGFVKFSVCEVARFKIDFFVVVVAICFILKADKSKNFLPKVGSFERTGLA